MNDSRGVVLFVDDARPVLTAYERALRNESFDVLTVESASAALEIVATRRVDVIVADERMPAIAGSDLLRRVRQEWPDIVRIAATGETDMTTMARAIREGEVYRFLCKPVAGFELSRTLRQALHMSRLTRQRARLGAAP